MWRGHETREAPYRHKRHRYVTFMLSLSGKTGCLLRWIDSGQFGAQLPRISAKAERAINGARRLFALARSIGEAHEVLPLALPFPFPFPLPVPVPVPAPLSLSLSYRPHSICIDESISTIDELGSCSFANFNSLPRSIGFCKWHAHL